MWNAISKTKTMLARFHFFAVFSLIFYTGNAQNCTLDIGGKNSETIVTVFQLNQTQLATMEALQGELEIETNTIEAQIEKLLAEHPQSTEINLLAMGDKYKYCNKNWYKPHIKVIKNYWPLSTPSNTSGIFNFARRLFDGLLKLFPQRIKIL